MREEKPLIGVIYQPSTGSMYHAINGMGSFLNKKLIRISSHNQINQLNVVWDFVKHSKVSSGELDQMNRLYAELVRSCNHVACLGNGSLSLAWLAQGVFDIFLDPLRRPSKFVDIAAGLLIAQEAGAEVIYDKLKNGNDKVVVASPSAMELLGGVIDEHLNNLVKVRDNQ